MGGGNGDKGGKRRGIRRVVEGEERTKGRKMKKKE